MSPSSLLSARLAVSDARPLDRLGRRVAVAVATASPRATHRRRHRNVGVVTVTAMGWFDNNKDVDGRDVMWEKQQEILRKRRGGNNVESEVSARRKKVSGFMKGTLEKGETEAINKKNRAAANALSKEAFKGKGFLPFPGMSIGMPEFDGGERFDLRAPYADEGWVDEEDGGVSNPFTLGGLFGGTKETRQADAAAAKKNTKKNDPVKKKKGWFGR